MTSAAQARAGRRTGAALAGWPREEERCHDVATRRGLGALATAIAEQASPRELCLLAAEHAARSVGAASGALGRLLGDARLDVAAAWVADPHAAAPSGPDLQGAGGPPAASAPVRAEGQEWGLLAVFAPAGAPPAEDAPQRIEAFARLLGVGIECEAQRARLALQASIDVQTGVLNHGAFHARLDEEVARALRHGRTLAVATVDIDHLQRVNDRHGHHEGDALIAAVAGVLVCTGRSEDVIGRIGGDKFGVLMPESDRMFAMASMERARAAIGRLGVGGLPVTVSAGVCDLETAGDATRMMRLADQALCRSKAQGRDRVWVHDEQIAGAGPPPEADTYDRATALSGIRALARAIDAKDSLTRQHSERVAVLACLLADRLGWSQARMEALHQAGLVHDVGKIGVPDAVLLKPGRLTGHEYELVKRHATLGAEIVQDVLTIEQVAWVRGHHERADGAGYPDGLAGDEIAEGAALLALADAFDVMTVRRSYCDQRSVGSAVEECVALRGRQFASAAVDALVALHAERRLSAFTDLAWHRRITRAGVEPSVAALSAPAPG